VFADGCTGIKWQIEESSRLCCCLRL